jgi:hypothetical protein
MKTDYPLNLEDKMDIVVISRGPVKNREQRKQTTRVPVPKKKPAVERRRNRKDRRKGVQEGVVVTLSYPNDRRQEPDRRR